MANAHIRVRNAASGQALDTATDADGKYSVGGLPFGDYTVTISASGFADKSTTVTISLPSQSVDFTLTELPSAPGPAPSNSASPSLNDLGFSTAQTQANPQLQATLERRTEMLKIHQRLGLITTLPMAAAVITGPMVKAHGRNGQTITEPSQTNLDVHAALGGLTTALYFSTAYFAIAAPRVPGTTKHGGIRWHEALAWVHGPGMVLTPVLGYMAYKQENSGEKVHGIASAHGAVAWVTAASYGIAIVAVSWPIHIKFWEKNQ